MIETFAKLIPESVQRASGSAFYSGRTAFSNPSTLYILGLNPGGSPVKQASETVQRHTKSVLESKPPEWSEYCDESWENAPPGTYGLQPRLLHMLKQLSLNPRLVPASNVIFVRSSRESTLAGDFGDLASQCWQFHQSVIQELKIQVILCFGKTAGTWVAKQTNAKHLVGTYVEKNSRRWSSVAYSNDAGLYVVTASHPSIADWTSDKTNPTPLLQDVLSKTKRTIHDEHDMSVGTGKAQESCGDIKGRIEVARLTNRNSIHQEHVPTVTAGKGEWTQDKVIQALVTQKQRAWNPHAPHVELYPQSPKCAVLYIAGAKKVGNTPLHLNFNAISWRADVYEKIERSIRMGRTDGGGFTWCEVLDWNAFAQALDLFHSEN